MAATDAKPVPRKNAAYRVTFPIWDSAGALDTAAGSLDSEVSIDGGTFADCANEATEIATASGVYFLDLTAAEMNGDTIAIIVKSSSGLTTVIILYPEEAGDVRTNVTQIDSDSAAATGLAAMMKGAFVIGFVDEVGTGTADTDDFKGDASLSSVDDFYNGSVIAFTSGALEGVARKITDYIGAQRNIVVTPAFPVAPSDGDTFIITGRIDG